MLTRHLIRSMGTFSRPYGCHGRPVQHNCYPFQIIKRPEVLRTSACRTCSLATGTVAHAPILHKSACGAGTPRSSLRSLARSWWSRARDGAPHQRLPDMLARAGVPRAEGARGHTFGRGTAFGDGRPVFAAQLPIVLVLWVAACDHQNTVLQ